MRKSVGVDMDGVIAGLTEHLVKVVEEVEGEKVLVEDIKSWDLHKYFSSGRDVYEYLDASFFRALPVIENSQRVVKELASIYDTYIITSATNIPESLQPKMEWLDEHFSFIPPENIFLCGRKDIFSIDYLIDDGIHNLEGFSGNGLLFDAPHNRQENRYTRVKNWLEVEKLLL